jgi:hypothetical protein
MEGIDPRAERREARFQRYLDKNGLEETEGFDPSNPPWMPSEVDTDYARQREAWDYYWNVEKEASFDKSIGGHLRDEGLAIYSLNDETARVASSARGAGGGLKGLARTVAGQGNLGGFRDPLYKSASGGVSKVKDVGSKLIKSPTALQKIGANKLNSGFAALSVANAGAAGWSEATGTNYNPLSVFASQEDGSFGWHPENFGKTSYEMDYEYDDDGEVMYQKDSSGNPVLDRNGKPKPLMRTRLDENGNPIPVKMRRAGGFGGEAGGAMAKAAGITEAIGNDLTMGGYDAFRANLGGVADLADMVGVGGQWSKDVRRNARIYVDNRDGAVDVDPLSVGAFSEALSGKIFDAYNRFMYPRQEQQSPNSL